MGQNVTALPPGFRLKTEEPSAAPLPPGFTIKTPEQVPLPEGFTIKDAPSSSSPSLGDRGGVATPQSPPAAATSTPVRGVAQFATDSLIAANPALQAAKLAWESVNFGKDVLAPDTPEQAARREAIRQAGEKPDQSSLVTDAEAGYRQMPGVLGEQLMNARNSLRDAEDEPTREAARAEIRRIAGEARKMKTAAELPINPVVEELGKQTEGQDAVTTTKLIGESLKTAPYSTIRTGVVRSLPSSWKSILGGVMGGAAGSLAGPPGATLGAAVGAGLGSYETEYNASVLDGLEHFGADINDDASVEKTLLERGDEIDKFATRRAAAVGFFDALAGGAAGKIATLPVRGLVTKGLQTLAGAGSDAVLSAAGEGAAQKLSLGRVDNWNDIYQEALGSLGSGAVTETGLLAVETVRRKLSNESPIAPMPTEDEYKAAYEESRPGETITKYSDARKEGRTLYAYAREGEPVLVGSYEQAEKNMAQDRTRSGKLIAVAESDVTAAPNEVLSTMPVNKWADLLVNPPTLPERKKALQIFEEYVRPEALDRVIATVKQVRTGAVPISALETEVQAAINASPLPLYRGDIQAKIITPKEDNPYLFNGKLVDLDEVDSRIKASGGTIVATNVKAALRGQPALLEVFDNTFNFADENARRELLVADETQAKSLFASGRVTWRGRVDGRFIAGLGAGRSFAAVKPDGSDVSAATRFAILADAPQIISDNGVSEALGFMRSPLAATQGSYTDEIAALSEVVQKAGKKVNSLGVLNPVIQGWTSILNRAASKLNVRTNTLVVGFEFTSTGELLLHGLPQSVAPRLHEFFHKHINRVTNLGQMYNAVETSLRHDLAVILMPLKLRNEVVAGMNPVQQIDTLFHEFGHVLSYDALATAPLDTLMQVLSAYRRIRLGFPPDHPAWRDKHIHVFGEFSQSRGSDYVLGFEEWIANSVAKAALSSRPGLGTISRFFKSTGNKLIRLLKENKKLGHDIKPEPEILAWLNSLGKRTSANYADVLQQQFDEATQAMNAKVSSVPTPAHVDSAGVYSILNFVSNQTNSPFTSQQTKELKKNIQATKQGVDRFNWLYKWGANLRQVSEANPHIRELQLARELFAAAKIAASKIHVQADTILQEWRGLGEERGKRVSALLFDLEQMNYRTADESAKGVIRWPNEDEFRALMKKYEVDQKMLEVYKKVRDFFLETVKRTEELQIEDAAKISDPVLREAAIAAARENSRQLVRKPYFPQTRFGKFTLTIRVRGSNKMEWFEMFETRREQKAAAERAMKLYPESDYTIVPSTLSEEVAPFVGMSPWMLDKIRSMPGLTPEQLDWIDQLRWHMAPSQSFTKHMMKKKSYGGFSLDGRRVFASYAYHHGRNYARVKYGEPIRQAAEELSRSVQNDYTTEKDKRRAISDMIKHQLNELMNPSQDWAHLRSLNALWHLGFNVKSAVVNMTQVLVTSAFLGAKFGGLRAEAALYRSSTALETFYRKGTYTKGAGTDSEFRAIDRAVQDGHIDESMAAELAAIAVGGGMSTRVGKSVAGDNFLAGYLKFTESAMYMFRMAEQWQRRVIFRASWDLAMKHPNTPWLQELKSKYILQYDQLIQENWTERETLAYLSGIDAITSTLGIYDRQARPRYMQGRKSVLFAFQMFTQQNLWMLWNNKDMMLRYMLYMGFLGGLTGMVPDDFETLFELMGKAAFGKQFNLRNSVREFLVELMGNDSKIPPDLILQGSSRYGFGLPAASELLGFPYIPEVDLSGSVSLGRLLPVTGDIIRPGQTYEKVFTQEAETVAGAAYSIPLGIAKALATTELDATDWKRWESAMPTAMRNLSKSWRYLQEGGERTKNYAQTIGFDGEDPEQLAEIIAVAMGFRPTRQAQMSERVRAKVEFETYWQVQKQILMRQAYMAKVERKDEAEFQEVMEKIKKHNSRAPDGKYMITKKGILQSFKTRAKSQQKIENEGLGNDNTTQMLDRLFPETVKTKQVK